ncbi:MAG: diaminopimelate epimerase [Nanoarchaeota archaeon]|nr:diaminopimelate epimerase [Nanoarchaeota archaeon]
MIQKILSFTKMHGTGNDYVIIDLFHETIKSDVSQIARNISKRRFSIGSDGIIMIKPWEEGDAEMIMYNPDGSIAEMCGNGLRCAAKYVHDYYQKSKKSLKILTGAGVKVVEIQKGKDSKAENITADLGKPIFEGPKIPTTFSKLRIINEKIKIDKQELIFSAVSMGNPHCIIFVNDVEHFPVAELGPQIETHKFFPKRINVEFVQILNRHHLIQRTWERGAGETLACGTGGGAVAVLSHILNHTNSQITIHFRGGNLQYQYQKGKSVKMTGPAVEVFKGKLNY